MKQESDHFENLLKSIKEFSDYKKINSDLSLLDEIERMNEILTILDRNWSIGIVEIHQACAHFILNAKCSRQEMKEICEAVNHWDEFALNLAQHSDFIRRQHYIYEQLLCYLNEKNAEEVCKPE